MRFAMNAPVVNADAIPTAGPNHQAILAIVGKYPFGCEYMMTSIVAAPSAPWIAYLLVAYILPM